MRTWIITGGAGFIGCHAAATLHAKGDRVILVDNLSRRGADANLAWLRDRGVTEFIKADIRDFDAIRGVIDRHADADVVLHLAGQVAVTTSVVDPRADFEINALGTLNVLEAVRLGAGGGPTVLYSSTNKVYGHLDHLKIVERDGRYAYEDRPFGVDEAEPLDFHSPYGCCFSEDTDVLTRRGWRKFPDLTPEDEVLTYSRDRGVAEFQRPTRHFAFSHEGKMYVQSGRRLRTCVTPNHKMFVAWDRTATGLINPKLVEAQELAGKPMAYLLAATVVDPRGRDHGEFVIPAVKPAGKHKHDFPPRPVPMVDWLRFFGWYLAEGHCYQSEATGGCTVTLTTYYRHDEAKAVMRAIGLSPCTDNHHVTAGSKQLYEYLKQFGKSHAKFIPEDIKGLDARYLKVLLQTLLDGDGNKHSKNGWRYTSVSKQLADDVQEIAIRCGLAARVCRDPEGFYRVYGSTTRTTVCNLGEDRSRWVDYAGMVYCVEVPNSIVMVRQGGFAYFSGNSKGAGDQYVRDYARIYGIKTVSFRQSCIYGTRQFGIEDQGWIAWFCLAATRGQRFTIFGDGKQIRDTLWIDDLIDAYQAALDRIDSVKGEVFNVGGGPSNTLSLLELVATLEGHFGRSMDPAFADWRPGDQPVFVADIRKAARMLDWSPKVATADGVARLLAWIGENRGLFTV
jgi:nucleoside-diphosphate-sugar epimerase